MTSWPILVATAAVTAATATGWGGVFGGAASAALLLTAAILAVHTIAGVTRPRDARVPGSLTQAQARARRVGVLRQCDPDAAGHARPRAPGVPGLAV
jgi:hypothetical protein